MYDNDIREKTVTIASLLPGGGQIPQEDAPGADPNRRTEVAAVSTNGSHILMAATTNPFCDEESFTPCPAKLSFPAHLYMRVNGAITHEISPGADAIYLGMTSDGSAVFFSTEDQLSPLDTDASVDLYRWSEKTDSLTLLSQGNGNGDTDECAAQWDSGCDIRPVTTQRPDLDDTIASESGDIYFYSPEQLDPEDPGVRNERNLYVYRQGAVHYVATFDPGTKVDRMQISPDGSHMAFLSKTQATAYANTQLDDQGRPTQWEEMYTFDPSNGNVQCASCIPSGAPPSIFWLDYVTSSHTYDVKASQSGRFMADDGKVAFSTTDALVSGDTNGKFDVYEFVDNRPQLISTGTRGPRHPGWRRLLPDPAHRIRGHQPRRHRPLLLDLRDARPGRPQRQLRQVLRRAHATAASRSTSGCCHAPPPTNATATPAQPPPECRSEPPETWARRAAPPRGSRRSIASATGPRRRGTRHHHRKAGRNHG